MENGATNDALGSSTVLLHAQVTEVIVCTCCSRGPASMSKVPLTIEDEEAGPVDHFCYLGNMLSCKGGVERALTVRTAATWNEGEIISIFTN